VTSPWLSWGPYLWADGSHARSDGLKWTCGEFEDDGTHPGPGGETKVASLLLDFFKHDPTTRPWFLAQGSTGLPDAHAPALSVRPNPTAGFVDLRLAAPVGAAWKIEVLDVAGRRVGEAGRGVSRGDESLTIDLGGLGLGRGVYWLVMEADGRRSGRRVTLID